MNASVCIPTRPEPEPKPDYCSCCTCHITYHVSELVPDEQGDYETGYYTVYGCPKCEDGGCICDFHMSKGQARKWNAWNKKQKKQKRLQ